MTLSIRPTNQNRILELLTGLLLVCVLGIAMLISIPIALAHKDDSDPGHSHGGGNNGGGDEDSPPTYAVDIYISSLIGQSTDVWEGNFNGKNGIGLNNAPPAEEDAVGELSDLSFFHADKFFTVPRGSNCFPGGHNLIQALLKMGKGGRAEGRFWFQGRTDDDNETPVDYVLIVFGQFGEEGWPPTTSTFLTMSDWEFNTVNEGGPIKRKSCIGEGVFGETPMEISVTPTS